jgi:hypothetical protein
VRERVELKPLLDDEDIRRLIEAGINSGKSFTGSAVRRVLLGRIDRGYAATLPNVDNDRGQLESDLRVLADLPYLVSKQKGDLQIPLDAYLMQTYGQLSPLDDAQVFLDMRDQVLTRATWRHPLEELLDALVEAIPAVPPDDLVAVASAAGVDLAGFDLDRAPTATWALALHVASRAKALDALLKAANERSTPRLIAAMEQKPAWAEAVHEAWGALLKLEVGPGAPVLLWQQVLERSTAVTDAALLDFVTYDPETFVPRSAVDEQLEAFRSVGVKVLVVSGESGSGKSSLMARWAKQLLDEGDAVVLLRGAVLGERDLLERLRSVLHLESEDWARRLEVAATDAERQVVVIIDGVNDVAEADEATGLFAWLSQNADRFPGKVRFVLTVLEPTWRRVARKPWIASADYYRPVDREVGVALPRFDDSELELAWTGYRVKHGIPTPLSELPSGLRRHVRNPSMMKIVAETFAGGPVPADETQTALKLYRTYYRQRTERGASDREFLRQLSLAIYQTLRSPIPLATLHELDGLGDYLKAQPHSAYQWMLDTSVLREIELGQEMPQNAVEYSVSRFGAWVLAGALRSRYSTRREAILAVIQFLPQFPPLADTVSLLLRWEEPTSVNEDLVELGGHESPDVRELVAEALAEISSTQPDAVSKTVRDLVAAPSAHGRESQRTGLRAAYLVTVARSHLDLSDVFLGIAKGNDESLRREALDTLYLTWEQHPRFVYDLMTAMAEQIEIKHLAVAHHLIEFLGGLSITLYTTHPGWDVGKPTSDLWYGVAQRLQLSKAASPLLAPVRRLVFAAGNRQFSKRVFNGFLLSDPRSTERMFRLSEFEKRPFVDAIELLEPAAELDEAACRSLDLLLRSDLGMFNLLAAQVIAVHSLANLEATSSVVEDLWQRQELDGRLWLLTAFSVLLETTPAAWVDLLEDLTRRTAVAHPEILGGVELGYVGDAGLDQLLFPLGLAYGKRHTDMPVLTEFLAAALDGDKPEQARRCVRTLGMVGFYHPRPVLQQLGSQWERIVASCDRQPTFQDELIRALATIRVLHLDEIDNFLLDMDAPSGFAVRVRAGVDLARLYEQVNLLGLYNNGVHQAVCFPKMRNGLLKPIYRLLAESADLRRATHDLTRLAWEMLVAAEFKLENWAEPPGEGGPCR